MAIMAWLLGLFSFLLPARALELSDGRVSVRVDVTGHYEISAKSSGWTWAGNLIGAAGNLAAKPGQDAIGSYHEIAFSWTDGAMPLSGAIRLYDGRDLILFSDTMVQASPHAPSPFPNFTTVPQGLFTFSYRNGPFAPSQFSLSRSQSSPWLFFDQQDHAMILSPASHFLIATLMGDGASSVASGFDPNLARLPAGFTQQTLMAISDGINHTYDVWGPALTDLQGKKRPASDADTLLKYLGYWTDNGAAYYYNYDPTLGYAGTLKALVDSYQQKEIPLHYLQLDSWWYHKTRTGPNGKEGHAKKNKLPDGDWNCYGGLLDYTAHPFVFPNGLAAFHQEVGLPFVTHNRWIDPASPYHQKYAISGLAAIDPKFWDAIADYMNESGIVTYEQDWLSEIFHRSPELTSTPDQGDDFLDNMARATQAQGQTMQYCMATPACFMQGSKYGNLTSIRTSGDRFKASRYHDFLYGSRLASALGLWPWSDVFKSDEITNLLLANLSAGPVGIGDAIGLENKENLFKAMRADGVLIKPDAPLVPTDGSYLAEAQKQAAPLVASTYSDHEGLRTIYAVVVSASPHASFSVAAKDLGLSGPAYVYDYFSATGQRLEAAQAWTGRVNPGGVTYAVIASVGRSGIAFFGDPGKFVSTGRQRIASLRDESGSLTVEVLLASAEKEVTLHGYADAPPVVSASLGQARLTAYDTATHHFILTASPDPNSPWDGAVDPVRHLTILMKTSP